MTEDDLAQGVRRDGYAFVRAADMRALLTRAGGLADWERFAGSWSGLVRDEHMADGGRDRLRRHAVLSAEPGGAAPRLEARAPHYQSLDYNPLNGGVARWFEPIAPDVVAGATTAGVLAFALGLFGRLRPATAWKIELHQFRIEARAGEAGRPTPEGMHRDGVDHVLVLLVGRTNIREGVTTTHDLSGRLLGSFTLTEPFDAALVDDHRVMHGVTPVEPIDPAQPAYRDVLVVTFRRDGA